MRATDPRPLIPINPQPPKPPQDRLERLLNVPLLVRVVDALQATDAAPIATPADWRPGDRVIVSPGMSTDEAKTKLENVEEIRPYLRWADQPS